MEPGRLTDRRRRSNVGTEVAALDLMHLAPQITFRDMSPIESIRSYVQKRIEKLETFHPHIMSCRVTVSTPHRHHQHGRHHRVAIDVKVPGQALVVDRTPGDEKSHEDFYAAADEAFDLMKRALKEHADKLQRRSA